LLEPEEPLVEDLPIKNGKPDWYELALEEKDPLKKMWYFSKQI